MLEALPFGRVETRSAGSPTALEIVRLRLRATAEDLARTSTKTAVSRAGDLAD